MQRSRRSVPRFCGSSLHPSLPNSQSWLSCPVDATSSQELALFSHGLTLGGDSGFLSDQQIQRSVSVRLHSVHVFLVHPHAPPAEKLEVAGAS